MLIQIVLLLFAVVAMCLVYRRHKSGELSAGMTLLWTLFWVVAGAAVVKPNATSDVAHFLGVGRGVDLVFYISLVVVFYFIFRIFIRFEKLERSLTDVVRDKALRAHDDSSKK